MIRGLCPQRFRCTTLHQLAALQHAVVANRYPASAAVPKCFSGRRWHSHSHGGHGHSHGAAGAGAIARGSKEHQAAGVRVTVGGAALNLTLAAAKGAVGLACNSSALVSDAVHSLSDLLSDAITLFVVQTSRLPPDAWLELLMDQRL